MNCRVGKVDGFISDRATFLSLQSTHQEPITARSLKTTNAMNSSVQTEFCVSFPNHREIAALLEETEIIKDEGKTYHIHVLGFSRGHVFQHFKYSRSFAERNNKGTEELDDEGWINNLASFVDVTGHC
jgi:hypothetical protein